MTNGQKNRIRDLLKNDKSKTTLVLILGVAAMFLLSIGSWLPVKDTQTSASSTSKDTNDSSLYISRLETRLADTINNLDGAGETRVMLTLTQSEEFIYALDKESDDSSTRETHIVLENSAGDALVERVIFPQIQGVAVLCEGGDDIVVQSRITEMIKVLTGVGSNKITVGKMS